MDIQKELDFLLRFLKNYHINTCFYKNTEQLPLIDFHIREILGDEEQYGQLAAFLYNSLKPNCIYKIVDHFTCTYFVFLLPGENDFQPLIIGPYVHNSFNKEYILQQIKIHNLTQKTFQTLQTQYAQIPILHDDISIQTLIQTFGETLWGNSENFTIKVLDQNLGTAAYNHYPAELTYEIFSNYDFKIFDSYLPIENRLMQAISQGNVQNAEKTLSSLLSFSIIDFSYEGLRKLKNYAIYLNGIFFKSSQLYAFNTNELFSIFLKFMKKIELCSSPEHCNSLIREMVRKYCLLVKNHSTKDYSPLIQKAIRQIDLDLSADLSLHVMAEKLNTNASYLSTQFKKATGYTYTEYIQKKRIKHSLLLLNTTSLQIQTIAQYCGIPDLNYFSKLFKKYIHSSPSAYRKEVLKDDV